ncbi:HotDog domain-containing protein [Aspergillus leporis]|uniref:Acyl-coenzyme A thioesterase THEM4 n=1 Tax=Aspergillus leporis TaxID=41062 RepID=A0A5N5WJP1_9EURO|nr:HotDog domain-containing protein [Aspergillus leporis]
MASYRSLITNTPVPQEDIDFFSSISFARPYLSKQRPEPKRGSTKNQDLSIHLPAPSGPDYIVFVQFSPAVTGFQDTVHGGVLAAMFDEAFGLCAEGYRVYISEDRTPVYTTNLEIIYRVPVGTPSMLLVKIWVNHREGRKWLLEAQLVGEEGTIRAEGKSLYISSRTSAGL